MAAAIVGLVGVVLGAGIGYLLAIRREVVERRNWRRDHALEAYSDVLKASETVHFLAIAAYIVDGNTEEHARHMLLIRDAIAELHRVVDRVPLTQPKRNVRRLEEARFILHGGTRRKCYKISEDSRGRMG